MKRILIIGNAGSGKTTFAKALANTTKLPLVHLDQIFWCGNWEHLSREEFDAILQEELIKPEWIMDGNFSRTLPHRLKYCDTVFYFDLPTITCLWSSTIRVIKNYGKTRKDMGGNCPEYFDKNKCELYRAIFSFNKKHRKRYQKLLEEHTDKTIVIFKTRKQAYQYLSKCKLTKEGETCVTEV